MNTPSADIGRVYGTTHEVYNQTDFFMLIVLMHPVN